MEFRPMQNELERDDALAILALSQFRPTREKCLALAKKYQADGDVSAFGAYEGGVLGGVLALKALGPGAFEVLSIGVLDAMRGHGVGRALISHAKAEMLARFLYAETDDDAVLFYEKCGFSVSFLGEKYPGVVRYACVWKDEQQMIREIKPDELPESLRILRESFATVARELSLNEQNCPRHTSFMTLERLQSHLDRGFLPFGLFEDGQQIGYCSLSREGDGVFELHNLAVLPACRHRGGGRLLLDFTKERALALGGRKLVLGMILENTRLYQWYLQRGFTHVETKRFPHLPFTVASMECLLRNVPAACL